MCALFLYSACISVPGHKREGVGDLWSAEVRDEVTLVWPMGKLRFRVYGPSVGAHSWNPALSSQREVNPKSVLVT